ncbi:MAG: efflux RND transporter periplasmic adaptor subunit [Burkholderiales bacterium]
MKKFSVYLSYPLALSTCALSLMAAGCAKEVVVSEPVRPVLTQKISMAQSVGQDVYAGEVRARHEADLGFRIAGKIISRPAELGTAVKKGALLASLDPQDVRLGAEAARSQVAVAQTEFEFAKAELDRNKELLEKNFISKAVYDAKLNSFNSAQAKLATARSQAAVSANQSAYASLKADFDGTITAVNAEVGQVVAAGQPVMKLAKLDEKEVVINIPENRLADVKKVENIAVRLWSAPDKIYRGKVREVAPGADATTRTYTAKISILEAADVKLGMTANVILQQNGTANVALIPLTALYQGDNRPAVWVVDSKNSLVNLRPIVTGPYREDGVVVLSGLADGELIVIAGVHKLSPGQAVRLPAEVKEAGKS